jgi:misacylated tRNA(Ala) deacylase
MHTGLHLLCASVPCGVTGGQIGAVKSRLDFDIGEMKLDKEEITNQLNGYMDGNHEVTSSWITDAEMDEKPDLVRTMSVKPPRKGGRVRLLKVGDAVDLQPCGGTHVKNTSEIGRLRVSKIENKGKRNRRVNIVFEE